MGLTIRCDGVTRFPDNLSTDICSINAFKWRLSLLVCAVLLAVGLYILHKWKYRHHHTLLLFHNLRAAVALLLLTTNTLELARALLPTKHQEQHHHHHQHHQHDQQQPTTAAADTDYVLVIIGSDLLWNAFAAILLTLMLMCYHRIVELKKVIACLYVSCIAELLIFFVRILELAEVTSFEYIYELEPCLQLFTALCLLGMATIDGFTIYKERFRPDYLEDYEKIGYKHTLATFYSKACFWWLTPLLWFGYKEPLELEDLGQMRLEDSARAHYDRFLLIYKTAKVKNGERPPSLWLCYVKSSWRMFTLGGLLKLCGDLCALIGPLAIQQIVQYIESIYDDASSNTTSSWMHLNNNNGGTNVGTNVAAAAVDHVNNSSTAPWRLQQQMGSNATNNNYNNNNNYSNNNYNSNFTNNNNTDNRFTNFHDNRRISLRTAATNWISNIIVTALLPIGGSHVDADTTIASDSSYNNTSSISSSNHARSTNDNHRILSAGIDYHGTDVQIYYPTWFDLVSNGWAIAWIVLLAALAQGALSQASTHILNMTGIRIKTSLQGLIYRKTLLLNSSVGCGRSDGANIGQATTNGGSGSNGQARDGGVGEGVGNIGAVGDSGGTGVGDSGEGVGVAAAAGVDNGNGVGVGAAAADNKRDGIANVKFDDVAVTAAAASNAHEATAINNNGGVQAEDADAALSDVGTITNLMSEDALNVMSFFWIAHYVWAIPLKIAVVMYLLYVKLGVAAIIGSFVCILTMTPLQFLIGRAMSVNTEKMAKSTDQRLRIIHDTLMGIKAIKFNVWTAAFVQRIDEKRNKELSYLFWDSVYWTLMTILTHISSVLITYVTLATYVALEGDAADFSASRLFSALALFQQLTVPLLIFPITVPIILSAVVSTRRLESFLSAREIHKQFEGIRHMARILSKSDASLDYYEVKDKQRILIGGAAGVTNCGAADVAQHENKLNERLALKLHLPESPAPLAQSEPQTPLLAPNEMVNPLSLLAPPPSAFELPSSDEPVGSSRPCELRAHSTARRPSQQRRELLRNSPYVVIRPRKFPNTHAPVTQPATSPAHRRLDSWSRDSLLLKLPDDMAVSVREARFAWHPQRSDAWLLNLRNVTVPRGKLTMIVGRNGSGKTSFLSALLMEMPLISGDIIWNKTSTIAFVPQQPWLLNGSIRENILFGESFRPRRYDFVLEACALKPDIELMPDADFTVIGERGINLSGGQRQRVAIARALYSSANVVILDDPLSSLDNEVSRHIFGQSIQRMLLKAKRTVILATQQLQLTQHADYLIVIKRGHLQAAGAYKEIELKHPHIIAKWQSIIAKASDKEYESSVSALGRTARERWKLYQNVTKLGLQRTKSTKSPVAVGGGQQTVVELGAGDGASNIDGLTAAGIVAVDVDAVANPDAGASPNGVDVEAQEDVDDVDADEEEDLMPVSLPSMSSAKRSSGFAGNAATPPGNFALTRSRSSLYGSRHLFYDAPLPIDECHTDEVILRRRRSHRPRRAATQRHQRPDSMVSTGSSRLSAISSNASTTSEWRRSGGSANSGSSLVSVDTGVDVTDAVHPPPTRVQSWQPQSAAEASGKLHQPVARNVSSPGCLLMTSSDVGQQQPKLEAQHDEAELGLSGGNSFQQFLRRMSMRRSAGHRKHRTVSGTNSILSITEESAPTTPVTPSLPSIELSVSTPECTDEQKNSPSSEIDSWIVHIENEESVNDANIDYKTLTSMTNAAKRDAAIAAGECTNLEAVTTTNTTAGNAMPLGNALATTVATKRPLTATSSATSGYDAERKYGKIPAQIYLLYLRASGWRMVLLFCVTALIWQGMRVYTDVWLQQWTGKATGVVNNVSEMDETLRQQQRATMATTTTTTMPTLWHVAAVTLPTAYSNSSNGKGGNTGTVDVTHYFHIYTAISCVCIVMALLSTPAGQLAGCNARQNLHDQLLLAIMRKSLHFFQITPLGRLMNRFGNDMAIIDKKIAATSQRLLQFTLLCLCAVLINVSITPWFMLLTVPICAAYYVIQKFYRCSARELQRIENSTNTPVISHLSETIQGVTTIRAYNQEARFTEILFKRLEANTIAFTILNTSNRWLGISLDFLGGVIVFVAIITALIAATISCQRQRQQQQPQFQTLSNSSSNTTPELTPTPSLVGLAINYTLLMPIYLNWVVKLLADMEMYVGSVERIAYYAEMDRNAEVSVDTYRHEASVDATAGKRSTTVASVGDVARAAGGEQQLADKLSHVTVERSKSNSKCPLIHFEVQRVAFCNKYKQQATAAAREYSPIPISWPRQGDITFEDVSLRYEGQREDVIKNLTLKIPYGQRIGICGRTGSGKSSLAMSLLGVLQASSGRICVDDVDITKIHPDELRMRISIIPQDVHLFNLSIRENLNPTHYYTVHELNECLRKVGLCDYVCALPEGIDTLIGDGGVHLSAGQRQLLALARILLRGSVCLILDEATSSLDSSAEQALLNAAHSSFHRRTIITIAHRLATILDYDRIIVLERGCIVEDGSPAELQQRSDGAFTALLQAGQQFAATTPTIDGAAVAGNTLKL